MGYYMCVLFEKSEIDVGDFIIAYHKSRQIKLKWIYRSIQGLVKFRSSSYYKSTVF